MPLLYIFLKVLFGGGTKVLHIAARTSFRSSLNRALIEFEPSFAGALAPFIRKTDLLKEFLKIFSPKF